MSKIICFEKNDPKNQGLWKLAVEFLQQRKATIPGSPTIIVSVELDGEKLKINGLVGIETVFHIEPLVADNPSAALD